MLGAAIATLIAYGVLASEIDKALFDTIKATVQPIETLLIFGTNRYALQTVIEQLKKSKEDESGSPKDTWDGVDCAFYYGGVGSDVNNGHETYDAASRPA